MKILITGGAGFIGSAVIHHLLLETDHTVVNADKLTYAGNLESLAGIVGNSRYHFERMDICDYDGVSGLFSAHKPDAVMHLAAESHVDRSIDGPREFIQTNIVGTYRLLEAARQYWRACGADKRERFAFLHVSTDEVFGSLGADGLFDEESSYAPNSPYSASKAASDHLVRAWCETYDFPAIITNCSNNYGPRQFPEKLIPVVMLNALAGKPLPVYGKGDQIRDWLFVEDHARALNLVLEKGKPGETYNIGGHNELRNVDVVHAVCRVLEDVVPGKPTGVGQYSDLIEFVTDRPGHDRRYAIDASKIQRELGWKPKESFDSGLRKTVGWYLENQGWWQRILDGSYSLERLGTGA